MFNSITVNMGMMLILLWTFLVVHVMCSINVKIGTIIAMNTSIGITALSAMKLALEDISKNDGLLINTQLDLIALDSKCSAFQGAAAATELFEEEVVSIIGPQTSVVSHFLSHMAAATQVPLISFSATDPSLSEYQYPYFLRVAQSDSFQMEAIADIIASFGWREVVAVYVDDNFGVNGINALADALEGLGITIVFRAALDSSLTTNDVVDTLADMLEMASKVYVMHMHPNMARMFLAKAYDLNMTSGFVWIVTEIVIHALDMDHDLAKNSEGILGVRTCILNSSKVDPGLENRLEHVLQNIFDANSSMNIYTLWAYDTIWAIALAIDAILKQHGNFTFELPPYTLADNAGGNSDLARLKILHEGPALLDKLLKTDFKGITGKVFLDKRLVSLNSCVEVVNIAGGQLNVVGHWSNGSLASKSANASTSMTVTWPGGGVQVPRGWVFPKNHKLIIGIPNKHGFKEFVDATSIPVSGFCIDVFKAAISNLSYSVQYEFASYGDGKATPSYDELVRKLANKEYDAIVGDIAITTQRSKVVDFTQPYATSGMVVVVPLKKGNGNYAWAFVTPFTIGMWCTTGGFFLFTGIIIWLLERKKNHDFRGRPRKQVVTTLWFSFSTLFFTHRDIKSTLGRAALIIWLFVILIIKTSYTASLTSSLTWQELLPNIQNIAGLLASNVQIGFQAGSFVENYLSQLGVPSSRLVPLDSLAAYTASLRKGARGGGVGAIVDELPYIQLFLSSNCDFIIAGQAFTKSGWGFAFQKGSQLAVDMSRAILMLSENGTLQLIHDKWFKVKACRSSEEEAEANELGMGTFWGLFLITGMVSVACLLIYYAKMFWHFKRAPQQQRLLRGKSMIRSFISYVEESQVQDLRRTQNLPLQVGADPDEPSTSEIA